MALWLQVNTTTGEIYEKLQTPGDASTLPTKPGGVWLTVQEPEFSLAVSGERTTWAEGNPIGSRVVENPYPRLRFTGGNVSGKPYEFALEVGQASPPQLGVQLVDRDGNVLTTSVTRRIYVDGSSPRYRKLTLTNGQATINIPVGSARIIRVNDQLKVLNNAGAEVDGFIAEDPLLIVVADAAGADL